MHGRPFPEHADLIKGCCPGPLAPHWMVPWCGHDLPGGSKQNIPIHFCCWLFNEMKSVHNCVSESHARTSAGFLLTLHEDHRTVGLEIRGSPKMKRVLLHLAKPETFSTSISFLSPSSCNTPLLSLGSALCLLLWVWFGLLCNGSVFKLLILTLIPIPVTVGLYST